jgi:hypothetical protein
MKNLSILLTVLLLSLTINAQQKGGQSFDNLPDNNQMVEKSLEVFNLFRNGQFEKLITFNPNDTGWINSIRHALIYFEKGIPADTIMIESYLGNERTEIDFLINCDDLEENLYYSLIITSNGIGGSTKDFIFNVEKETNYLIMRKELMDFPSPKSAN